MARPAVPNNSVLPEFMTSVSIGDFFAEWLNEQINSAEARAREEGSSRAAAWELRTLRRAHGQFTSYTSAALSEES